MKLARILLICGAFGCGSAFGASAVGGNTFDCNLSAFFAWSSITQVVDSYCTNDPLTFTFDTPVSNTGLASADYVFVDGSKPLASPKSPGISFFGSTNGTLGDPVTSGPIEIQFAVGIDTGKQFVVNSAQVDHLMNGGSSGTVGGAMKFCEGALFAGSSFTDDGCVANGGVLYSSILASGNVVSFANPTTLVDVWDEITFSGGASFGQIGQTFAAVSGVPSAVQTIWFSPPGRLTFSAAPITLTATASSGLPVSFASGTPATCTVSGTSLTLVATATCSVTAVQPGNAIYAAAVFVTQSFTVSQGGQTITFTAPGTVTLPASPFGLSATADSGLLVNFTSTTTSVCTVSGSTATPVAAGICSITASQAGSANYAAAIPVTQSITINSPSGGRSPRQSSP